ncbi:esterase/lipase family protein [Clostridium oryzae]|uniref:triacylglycerol lipase n=1 Tax=Clostridium oryzae TaxID=1450648 RepID=A0A1V4IRK2_9CLOT|nr:lipase [Clostridium oryzae]OPJ62434.1 lipase precursor [Clostridium oryzae]
MKKINKLKIAVSIIILLFCFFIPNQTFAISNIAKNNKKLSVQTIKGNNYPIVMVHGLFGWGNNELAGLNYWGGAESLQQKLVDKRYTVYTPSIGPVSSNWDRACELYAYIKGGTVDYGEAHSKKYGHNRYGRTYPGVYPAWGTVSNNNVLQKVHLLGHSMGGQTIRTLVQLLENGNKEEQEATSSDNISPLFTGGNSWVSSVTTIATPHDGSQESHRQYSLEPLVHQFFAAWTINNNLIDAEKSGLDFQLDQWGLKKESNESYRNYFNRVMKSNIWGKTKDLSDWDLSPEGAEELNSWVKAQDDVYYFSLACSDTHKSQITNRQLPNQNMNAVLLKSSLYLGSYINNNPGEVPIDSSWWENDGIVSVKSAICPKVGSADKMVEYNGIPQKGTWNYLGLAKNVDHLEVVQMTQDRTAREQQFYDIANMLKGLSD